MPFYESTFIARQDISANQVDSLAEGFTAVISENGGSVERQEYWGLRTLAYRIKKNRKGHYVLFYIDAPAGAVAEMERNMRLSEDVLRYLTVRVDELDPEPSVIMQARASREGSRRSGGRGRSDSPPVKEEEKREEADKKEAKSSDAAGDAEPSVDNGPAELQANGDQASEPAPKAESEVAEDSGENDK